MSKVRTYQKAWSLALKGDFSLVDQIYHPEYRSFDLRTGIYTNIDDDKVIVTTENEEIFTSYPDVLYENDEFLCIIAYQKVSDPETLLAFQNSFSVSTKDHSSQVFTEI